MKLSKKVIGSWALIALLFFSGCGKEKKANSSQSPFKGLEHLFTPPRNYVVYKVVSPVQIDGDIHDEAWQHSLWTEEFVDIEGSLKPDPFLKTRVKMLWDDEYLYMAAEMADPNVWATLKNHDATIYQDNDFEFFIDADNDALRKNLKFPDNDTYDYYEFEINALNTTWDLFLDKPYRNGGLPLSNWEIKGLKTAVKIQGTLNDPSDKDIGWTVELAIPLAALNYYKRQTPHEGTQYRINFMRAHYNTQVINNQYVKLKDSTGRDLPCYNWSWSPQGIVNMHCPERWGYLKFSTEVFDPKKASKFVLPYSEGQKKYLWLVYYRQKEWMRKHSQYALTLEELEINKGELSIDGKKNTLEQEATSRQFTASIEAIGDSVVWMIDQDGRIRQLNR